MIKYGIIGTGWIAEEFAGGAQAVENFKLTAVYSRTAVRGETFAKKFGLPKVYTDLNDFIDSDIDAVYVASPNSLHYEQSRMMLENGKHVICEKPITVNEQELACLQSLAKKNGLVYMEAIMYLYSPARQMLLDAMKKIGKITSAHFDFSQFSSKYPAFKRGELPNIFNPKFATGCLMDLGIYCIYPALDFWGKPNRIMSSSGFLSTGADGYGTSIFDYDDKQITLTYSKLGQSHHGSQIFGDNGTITIESISKLTNMDILYHDGTVERITGETPKKEIMGYEAQGFNLYINEMSKYCKKYDFVSKLAIEVSKTMEIIRQQCEIKFE